jgi:hypothetical protein
MDGFEDTTLIVIGSQVPLKAECLACRYLRRQRLMWTTEKIRQQRVLPRHLLSSSSLRMPKYRTLEKLQALWLLGRAYGCLKYVCSCAAKVNTELLEH